MRDDPRHSPGARACSMRACAPVRLFDVHPSSVLTLSACVSCPSLSLSFFYVSGCGGRLRAN